MVSIVSVIGTSREGFVASAAGECQLSGGALRLFPIWSGVKLSAGQPVGQFEQREKSTAWLYFSSAHENRLPGGNTEFLGAVGISQAKSLKVFQTAALPIGVMASSKEIAAGQAR